MLSFILKRLITTVPVLLAVALLVFLIMYAAPGDAADILAGPSASEQVVEEIRLKLGLDQPMMVQFVRFVGGLLRGDLGISFSNNRTVASEIVKTFPATFQLALAGALWSILLSIPLGVTAATRRNTIYDKSSMLLSMFGVSLPVFWIGLMLMWLFAVKLGWFPISGRAGPPWTWEGLKSLILPALALGAWQMAAIARLTRSVMLDVLNEDYVRTARSKGLAPRTVVYKHALRNALLPVVTVMGVQLGVMLGGAVVTETVFNWPGMGRLTVSAIINRDFPMAQGGILTFALSVQLINLMVDIFYAYLDPRVRYS